VRWRSWAYQTGVAKIFGHLWRLGNVLQCTMHAGRGRARNPPPVAAGSNRFQCWRFCALRPIFERRSG